MAELIQYVDDEGQPTGETAEKLAAHTAATRRHLAFSCYIFNDAGELLVAQRASVKKVWPDVWTNSVCGHPAPGEDFEQAIRRRSAYELGLDKVTDITVALPTYVYQTEPYNGIIENEFCPVFLARTSAALWPNPDEVDDFRWMAWRAFRDWQAAEPGIFSYWCLEQARLLEPQIVPYVLALKR